MSENKTSTGLTENVAGLLCYLLGFITGIIFLIIEKDSKVVKFHAWQSTITFGAIFVVQIILWILAIIFWPFWIIYYIIGIIAFILWIIFMVKAYQGQMWKVPIAGNIAAKQAGV
jgi:uncharacterized membrane protein